MTYRDLRLEQGAPETCKIDVNGTTLEILPYLPIRAKMAFVEFVVQNAVDDTTGTFSPIRVEVFFSLALARWYAGITFEDGDDLLDAYDRFEEYGILAKIREAVDEDEYGFMSELVEETVADIARYNNSFAGMVQIASANAQGLDGQITEILEKIKNREGMELLGEIKDMVGTD